MDPEYAQKIDRILELAEENNQYVRQVRRSQKTSQMFKAIWWVIGLAIVASAYYTMKPYIGTVTEVYETVKGFTQ